MSKPPLSIVVCLSGNGSTLQAIIDTIASGHCQAQIKAVISNNPDAYGLERARSNGIETHVINKNNDLLLNTLLELNPDLIVLAGYMRILPESIVSAFTHEIINIHPSLLPKYPGLNTYERVLAAGDQQHGTTVHFVTADLDAGPIIRQSAVDVAPDDTPETLKQKVQALEHQLYPEVIQLFCEGKVTQ